MFSPGGRLWLAYRFFFVFPRLFIAVWRSQMKLTSKEIKNIIKEELQKLLQEQESKESLITKVLGAYKNKTEDRGEALEAFLNFFEQADIEDYDKEFAFKWMKVLTSKYPEFRKALQVRIPGSRIIVYGIKKRKDLDLVLKAYSYEQYKEKYMERKAEDDRKKKEEERAERIRKAQKAAAEEERADKRSYWSDYSYDRSVARDHGGYD